VTVPKDVAQALADVVGARWVRASNAELATYAADALPTRRCRPGLVVLPGDRAQVAAVVRILADAGVPFVARGAGTGLSGGAIGDESAVVVVLTRLTRILAIDPANRTATVEAGVVNDRLTAAAAPYGLHYAPDPSSQTVCTIGGNVAENAGGPHCLKYGVTTNHILALDVVLPDGSLATLGSPSGEAWGPDLVGLFVGSEGRFGIATAVTVRLTPTPSTIRTLLADFTSLPAAGECVSAIIATGIVPAALEMMDRNCIRAVEASIYAAGYPTDAEAVLLVELDGRDTAAVAEDAAAVRGLLETHGARRVDEAVDPATRARLWHGRKKAFGALGRISRDLVVQDTVVPRSTLPDVLRAVEAIGTEFGITISNVFHAGDGNLHPNINFDAHSADETARVEAAAAAIMHACVDAGGTVTGEHGVGLDKIRYLPLIFDSETLGAMWAVQRVFDPRDLANPGKVLPTAAATDWHAGNGRSDRRGAA
jgi:glycolate oxidase subunit GlcD